MLCGMEEQEATDVKAQVEVMRKALTRVECTHTPSRPTPTHPLILHPHTLTRAYPHTLIPSYTLTLTASQPCTLTQVLVHGTMTPTCPQVLVHAESVSNEALIESAHALVATLESAAMREEEEAKDMAEEAWLVACHLETNTVYHGGAPRVMPYRY